MADLVVQKSVDNATPAIGSNVTFNIVISNHDPATVNDIVILDKLPSGYTYVSSLTTNGTYNRVTGVWNVGTLIFAQQGSLFITATVLCSGTYDNTATIINPPQPPPNSVTQIVMPTGEFCNGKKRTRRGLGAFGLPAILPVARKQCPENPTTARFFGVTYFYSHSDENTCYFKRNR